jgi:hypothetical protein
MGGMVVVRIVVVAAAVAMALSAAARVPAQSFSPPASPVTSPLDTGHEISQGIITPTSDPAKLPFAAGSVTAHWYQYFGFYVVRFSGLDLDTGYCVGTSSFSMGAFRGETNDATQSAADCPAEWPKASGVLGTYECGGELVYRTAISTGTGGELYATVNKMLPTAGINGAGLAGVVTSNLPVTPVIDLAACTQLTPATPTPTRTAMATTTPFAPATATATATASATATLVAPGPPDTGTGLAGGGRALLLGTVGALLALGGAAVMFIGLRR